MSEIARRTFLRSAGLAVLGAAAAACSSDGTPDAAASSPSPTPTTPASPPASPTPSPSPAAAAWRKIEAAGPPARRDATLTAVGRTLFLFGGRTGADTLLNDLWAYDRSANAWTKVNTSSTPKARFGHNAAAIGGKLVVFGGQSGPNSFLNDIQELDPGQGTWRARSGGAPPAPRSGAGDALVGDQLVISHGFTNSGRFDDTWAWGGSWANVSPTAGIRPVKRCLHRAAWWPEQKAVALFGGQTTGTPFLNDFWLYDTEQRTWSQAQPGTLPGPRTLFAMFSLAGRLWVYGGFAPGGEIGDTWWIEDPTQPWVQQPLAAGATPPPRGGVAATVAGEEAFMFGGRTGTTDLAELWAFRPGTT